MVTNKAAEGPVCASLYSTPFTVWIDCQSHRSHETEGVIADVCITMLGEGHEETRAHRAVRNVNVVHLEVAAPRSVRADGEHTCVRVMLSRQLGRLVDVRRVPDVYEVGLP